MSSEDSSQQFTNSNVYCLSSFRSHKYTAELGESYSAYLEKLSVADLFYEAKNTIDEIQRANIDVYHLKKADRILQEISRRVEDDSPNMGESLKSLRNEIKDQIDRLVTQ